METFFTQEVPPYLLPSYADDLLVFSDGEKRSMKRLLITLEKYERWLGQSINRDKSSLFMSKQISSSNKEVPIDLQISLKENFRQDIFGLHCSRGDDGRMFDPSVEKILNKIAAGKGKLLS